MKNLPILNCVKIINQSISHFEGLKYYVATGDLSDELSNEIEKVTFENKPSRAQLIAQKGDLVVARMKSTNKVLLIDELSSQNIYSTGFLVLRPTNEVWNQYLYHYLKSDIFQNEKDKHCTGATQKAINNQNFEKLSIPLPPLPIQKRIADILDAADALRKKDQELLKKYDELAQAIFIDMFGDPVKNEKGWEKVKMENLITIVRGGSPRPIENFLGGEYPWIKIGDATKGDEIYLNATKEYITKDGLSKTRLLPVGSLIFANCGVSLGFARIITFSGCIHDGWLAFSDLDENKLNKLFLLKALNSITEYFRKSAPEGTQPNLNIAIMKDFELIIPPIELQNKFELILSSHKSNKSIAKNEFEKSTNLFESLMNKAFSGELVS
jgi:type I restriction enzyme S subunit